MSGAKKDDKGTGNERGSSPASGAGLGMLSMAKNKKIMTIIGGILMAIGIGGMIAVGSSAIGSIFGGGFARPGGGIQYQELEYVFMFMLIAGLVLVIYSQIVLQSRRAKARERESNRS
ncbi:MAG: hypothetical protein M3270_10525 [Thermoproteota archaeon]|jgi:uncharacterized membrane-anchored protein YitT (DUF2179 family)|nr:hypothetical protein [Thermoproteota archaeon]